jgi:hypothetical protein
MQNAADFTLPITVTDPDELAEELATTAPFERPPGADFHALPTQLLPLPEALPPSPHTRDSSRSKVYAGVIQTGRPVAPRPAPLSDEEEARIRRRQRAYRRMAWAQHLLQRFGFERMG